VRVIKLTPAALLFTLACLQAADPNSPEKTTVEFMLDGYYSCNRNHPAGRPNQLHMFDVRSDQRSLSGARVSIERESDPVGYHLELGAGGTYTLMHSTETAPRLFHYLPQAYLSWRPSTSRDLRIDFGRFYTSVGLEVIESIKIGIIRTHQGTFLAGRR
jgi:hypothetical protein